MTAPLKIGKAYQIWHGKKSPDTFETDFIRIIRKIFLVLPSRHISPIAAIGVENRQVCRQNLETTTREIEMNSQ